MSGPAASADGSRAARRFPRGTARGGAVRDLYVSS
jgi:hypothetical protein